MRSALAKDTLRTIRRSARRFASLAAICVLGTTMLIGITIACRDLRLSADEFFDAQRLYDVSVQSTLGLTDDDVSALAGLDGVEAAQGGWTETAYTEVAGARQSVSVSAISKDGMNEPYLLEGRLPASADELAATSEYLEASGRRIGDSVTFGVDADAGTWAADDASEHQRERAADLLENVNGSDDIELDDDARELLADIDADDLARAATDDGIDLDRWADLSDDELTKLLTHAYEGRLDDLETDTGDSTELFARHTYKIVGEVIDPTSVAAKNGSASFRSTGAKYSFFVASDAATASAYSVVYLRVAGASGVSCFSDEYKRLVEDVKGGAEAIKAEREDAREQQIAADGNAKIDDAEESANEQFSKVEDQLAQAQATIDDALAQIEASREQLESQKASAFDALAQAQGQIDAGRARLADPATREAALAQATQAARDALAASDQYQAGVAARDALVQARDAHDALTQGAAQLEASIATLSEQIDQLEAAGQDTSELTAQLVAMQGKLAHVKGQIDALDTQLATQNVSADQLPALIEAAQAQLDAAEASVVTSATSAVDDQLAAMSAQLDEGQATLDAQRAAAQQMLDEAAAQLADAQAQADEATASRDSKLQAAKRAADTASAKLARQQDQLTEMRRDPSAGAKGLSQASSSVAAALAQLENARENVARVNQETGQAVQIAQTHLYTQRKSLEEAETDLAQARAREEELRGAYDAKRSEADEQESAVSSKTSELKESLEQARDDEAGARGRGQAAQAALEEARDIHAHPELTDELSERCQESRARTEEQRRLVERLATEERTVRERTQRTRKVFYALVAAAVVIVLLAVLLAFG